ncbi:unnamed protein product [Blepharisma stoltei]|uniref:Uncharacterized protein n=1 Tax=Blepharisma stoltei TaxID=1481888 RepID=A0AAU9IBE4_9CILI|nr:unnamed protein product [Blepharisma stoltei]
MSYTYQFKFIIIGDTGVGKSCLMLSFIDNRFRDDHDVTIGVEFGSKIIDIENTKVNLQIWDTAGSECFKSITRSYYRSAAGALLVYDITKQDSFKNVAEWLGEARTYGHPNMVTMLIGNKIDISEERAISIEDGKTFAKENDLLFTEASAKTGEGVDQAFTELSRVICERIEEGIIDVKIQSLGITIRGEIKKNSKNKSGCC